MMTRKFIDQSIFIINIEKYDSIKRLSQEEIINLMFKLTSDAEFNAQSLSFEEIDEGEFTEMKDEELNSLSGNIADYDFEKSFINLSNIPELQKFYFLDLSFKLSKDSFKNLDARNFFINFYKGQVEYSQYSTKIYENQMEEYFILTADASDLLISEFNTYKYDDIKFIVDKFDIFADENYKIGIKKYI